MNGIERTMDRTRRRVRLLASLTAVIGMASCLTALATTAAPPAMAATPPIVTTGEHDSCAITSTLLASCWGDNGFGELGNGSTTDSHVPVQVAGLPPATAIDAGDLHVCAIDVTKQPWCWGKDNFGQLGNGTTTNHSAVPVMVAGSVQAIQIGAGNEFSCALVVGGAVYCWGRGDEGQLGNGTNSSAKKPKQVIGLPPASAIAVGGFHACAVLLDGGAVRCWGANTFGALGNGTTTSSNVPVPVAGIFNALTITAGGFHTCALLSGGDVQCWGDNFDGQVGDGTNTDRLVPAQVVGLTRGATQISAGLSHTCALLGTTNDAACWGDGFHGQLGDGVFASTNIPVPYLGPVQPPAGGPGTGPVQVAAGYSHTCVSMTTGVVECFGSNEDGELGNGGGGIADASAVPVLVIGLTTGTQAVNEGGLSGCALTQALGVKCWGSADGNDFNLHTSAQDVTALPNGVGLLGVGVADVCALSTAGALSCWGRNDDGEVGVGDDVSHPTPQAVSGVAAATVVGGSLDTCAIDIQGSAYCWGDNQHGQIGDGTTTSRFTPTAVQKLPGHITQIANNGSLVTGRTCAVVKKGKAFCWGDDTDGALGHNGSGQQSLPVSVLGLPNADPVQLATGGAASCALLAGGQVWCWGSNGSGELGNGSPFGSKSKKPVQVSLSGTAIQLVGTAASFCALVATGDVFCWGGGGLGELGNGATSDSNMPVQVVGLGSRAIEVSGVADSFCALLENPVDVQCWGDNASGELGDGSTSSSDVPVSVQGL
jgi:alpha-tubulin suppressor-like RCC1 family protein